MESELKEREGTSLATEPPEPPTFRDLADSAGYVRDELVELVRAGMLGEVGEAHIWTNRPIWPQGVEEWPEEELIEHRGLFVELGISYLFVVADLIPLGIRLGWHSLVGAAYGDTETVHFLTTAIEVDLIDPITAAVIGVECGPPFTCPVFHRHCGD